MNCAAAILYLYRCSQSVSACPYLRSEYYSESLTTNNDSGDFISYATQSNLAEVELYSGFNNRSKPSKDKRHFKTKSKPPIITIKSRKSPKLSPEEQITIDNICASGEVFFKPRKRKTAEFESFEPWHFIFPDLHSYQGWLYANRLSNAMYSGWDFDVFDVTESGEGL